MLRDEDITRISAALAEELGRARESAGLSKSLLAQRAGVAIQTVSFIEQGVNSPSIATYLRLCSALDVSPEDLLRRAQGAPPNDGD